MRIGIDARFYNLHGGLGRYVSQLINELVKLPTDHEWYFFVPTGTQIPALTKRCHLVDTDIPWYGWQEQIQLPRLLSWYQLDLMHFPHFNIPLAYRRPFVVTIHDLILLTQPDSAQATTLGPLRYQLKRWAYLLALRRAVGAARFILTTSEYTKQDIIKFFPTAVRQSVTYQASRWPITPTSSVRQHQLLYIGNCYPHKNVSLLIQAFNQFHQRHTDYRLIIGSHSDAFFRELQQRTKADSPHLPVTFLADPSDDEVKELYQTSELYVFPSRYEGFGLPGLEAMTQGLPVISSDSSCLPEIYGQAAHYFQSDNLDDLVQALEQVATSPVEQERLRLEGYARAADFSWHRLAVDTLAIYEKALS